ncbi:MAG: BatA domain-containing protein [Bryobacterales bacterium]|nr:BatA domain-containing protein [Bryobacterales bacterium]
MGFLAPWFLAGTLALAIPVYFHLLRQHKTTPLPFSSLMFFEQRTQSSVKHRRLKYLALLVMRLLLLLLLALAFANPFWQSANPLAGAGSKLVVVAVDNSFSMRQGSRLADAKQAASAALSAVRGGDLGQALSFSGGVTVLHEPTKDLAALRGAIAAVEPDDGRGSFAELARTVRLMAQNAGTPVELHVFSDMQKTGWPPNFADARLSEGVRLEVHTVANRALRNVAVEQVNAPGRMYDPKQSRVQVTLAGYSNDRAERRVSLFLNGKEIASKDAVIEPGGRASVEFLSLDAPYGFNRGEVRIAPADEFPSDDRFLFAVERADPRKVLFLHDAKNTRDLLYFRTAIESAQNAGFVIEPAALEQAAGLLSASGAVGRYPLTILSDVGAAPANLEDALRRYVEAGGALWIALGRQGAQHGKVPVLGLDVQETRYVSREGARFLTVSEYDRSHPALDRVRQWEAIKFYQAVLVDPGPARVLARLSDGTPLLLERPVGEGRVMVFASTFDNVSNDFPLHASFVPFVLETARFLARVDEGNASAPVGSFFELRRTGQRGENVEVLDPSGQRAMTLEEAARAQNLLLAREGFYDVRWPSGRQELIAVNADRKESNSEILPEETLALWKNTGEPQTVAAGADPQKERRNPLGWALLWAVLAMALVESWFGNRHLQAREA